jgi:hypothetical protein
MNQMNPTFFTRASLQRAAALPVLGSVTMMLTPQDHTRRRHQAFVWCVGIAGLLIWTVSSFLLARQAAAFFQGLIPGVTA